LRRREADLKVNYVDCTPVVPFMCIMPTTKLHENFLENAIHTVRGFFFSNENGIKTERVSE